MINECKATLDRVEDATRHPEGEEKEEDEKGRNGLGLIGDISDRTQCMTGMTASRNLTWAPVENTCQL